MATISEITHASFCRQASLLKRRLVDFAFAPAKPTPLTSHTFSAPKSVERPLLARPTIGEVALFYVLTKIGIISQYRSQACTQQEVKLLDKEIQEIHKQLSVELEKERKAKKSLQPWAVMTKVMSWIGSFLSVATGAVLIATGAGAVAGALLIAGGLLSLVNHFMEVTGGWEKLVKKIGGDNPEKIRAAMMWIQISIAIVSIVLAGAGIVFGGIGAIKEAMAHAGMLSSAGANASIGVLLIGHGIVNSQVYTHKALVEDLRKQRKVLAYPREDRMGDAEEGLSTTKRLWEDFFRILRIWGSDINNIHSINGGR